jgi:purine-binding chemotaxis protein CheW
MTNPLDFLAINPDVTGEQLPLDQRERRELLIAQRQGRSLGVFANETEGIVEWKTPTVLPGAGPAVLGLIAVRGRMFTVIDPQLLLGGAANSTDRALRFIVLLAGEDQLALAVDRVSTITEVLVDDIEFADGELILGQWRGGGDPVGIIDPSRIFQKACGIAA